MKKLAFLFLMVASILAVHFSLAADTSDRPPGVEAKNWIVVNENLGFVIAPSEPTIGDSNERLSLLLTPAATGYFMARTADGWRRLIVIEPIKGPGTVG